jgi:hypothetical protein
MPSWSISTACPHPTQWWKVFDFRGYVQAHGLKTLRQQLGRLTQPEDSPLEAVLRRYGLPDVADQAAILRRDQAGQLRDALAGYHAA